MAAAAHDLEILGELSAFGFRVAEGVGEADAVDRVLRDAVDHARRGDADDFVDGRDHVVHVVKLRARRRVGLDLRGPPNGHRVAGAAKVRSEELGPLVGRAAGPGPAGVILVVGLGRTEHIEAAKLIERLDVHRNGGRNAVLRQQLADGAVLAFRRGAVVTPDVEDQSVVAVAEVLDFIDEPADMVVCMLGIAGGDLHQAALERLLILGDAVPGRQRLRPRRQLGVSRESSPFPWRA